MTDKTIETKKAGRPTNAEKIAKLKEQNDSLMKSNAEREERYNKLEAMLEQLMENQNAPDTPIFLELVKEVSEETPREKIPQDEYIKVVSLCPHSLNLSRRKSDPSPKSFRGLGETKRIMYKDLVEIMDFHPNFLKDGLFYIADERVVREHGLDDLYATLLTEATIRSIVNGKSESLEEVFNSANDSQKRIITDIIVERMAAGRDVDLNMVDRLERTSGMKISERAKGVSENIKHFEEMQK